MNEGKTFENAYHEYRCCTSNVAHENSRIEHLADAIAKATKERDEQEERRQIALTDLGQYLTAEAIAELKAVTP